MLHIYYNSVCYTYITHIFSLSLATFVIKPIRKTHRLELGYLVMSHKEKSLQVKLLVVESPSSEYKACPITEECTTSLMVHTQARRGPPDLGYCCLLNCFLVFYLR